MDLALDIPRRQPRHNPDLTQEITEIVTASILGSSSRPSIFSEMEPLPFPTPSRSALANIFFDLFLTGNPQDV